MRLNPDGEEWTLHLSRDEAITLHEVIARAEFLTSDISEIETMNPAEGEVLSRVQLAIAPFIEQLGTDQYDSEVNRAWQSVNRRG